MFSRMGSAAYKKDITNTIKLCEKLGNPQNKFKTIHVAGTNGKGSVTHMLSGIFQSAAYKTGLYTSPHLYDFRERIRINGEMINKEFVIEFVERMIPLIKEIEPSFFEITVAMAFEYFANSEVDIAIIEVGLGGRLDSTNVITPELSIITNIGWDHMNLLGNSLEEIAMEKAGIIKENTPVVIGEKKPETENVFYKAAIKQLTLMIYYELQWVVPAAELLDAYRHFIRTDKLLPKTHITKCNLFINYFNRLLKLNDNSENNTFEISKLISELKQTPQIWLLKKAQELEIK